MAKLKLVPQRLAHRLALGYGVVLSLMVTMMLLALLNQSQINERMRRIFEVDGAKADGVVEMISHVNASALSMRNLSVINNPADLGEEFKRLAAHLGRYDQAVVSFEELLARAGTSEVEQQQFAAAKKAESQAREIMSIVAKKTTSKEPDDLAIGIRTELRLDLPRWNSALASWIQEMETLRKLEGANSRQSYAAMNQATLQARAALLAMALVALGVGGLAAWKTTRDVTRPVATAVNVANRIANGDLSQRIVDSAHGELGQLLGALEKMRQQLHRLAMQVRQACDQIGMSSAEIAAANMDLSTRTEAAAANLQRTAYSMGELERGVTENAAAAKEADGLASTAAGAAKQGGDAIRQGVASMDQILASSKQIGDIVGVIDGIAFQTNVLALNAAVEAARAGDRGRGFGVVASEVRSLAQRSAEAAKQIKELIARSSEKVNAGAALVRDAGTTMEEVVVAAQRVSQVISEINTGAAAQRGSMGQINAAVKTLDDTTQQNAAMVEEAAAAAASLSDQARNLTELVSAFRLESAPTEESLADTASMASDADFRPQRQSDA